MQTYSEIEEKKSIHYQDPLTGITRRQFIAFAKAINTPRVIRQDWDDWLLELGEEGDRTNLEAIATWVENQMDILVRKDKCNRVPRLRQRFKETMDTWLNHYLGKGFEVV